MSTGPSGHPPLSRTVPYQLLIDAVNRILAGRLNCTQPSFTLNTNSTTTILTDARLYNNSFVDFMPTTADAASAKSGIWVSNQVKGSATINHASSTHADMTFTVLILG